VGIIEVKKFLIKIFSLIIFSLAISISGCNVADKINENILDIENDDSTQNGSNIDNNKNNDDLNNSKPDNNASTDINTSIGDGINVGGDTNNSDGINVGGDTNLSQCATGYHIENNQCVQDNPTVIDVDEFNLSFPNYDNAKSINLIMAKNAIKQIVIRSNPKQTDTNTKLVYYQYTNNSVVTPTLAFNGAPIVSENYDYKFTLTSGNLTGKDEFQLTLENENGFTDSVYINVEVVNQIKLAGIRETYTLVTDGEEQNITITAYNTLGNPLEFEIVNQALINEEGNLNLIVIGSKKFATNTASGVDFKFSARGLEDDSRQVQIKVKDTLTGTVESIYITIESVKRNTYFYVDLYECGETLTKSFEVTSDENTPLSPDGVYSADNAIYIKSTHDMAYDIGNKFSTVMIFHPTTGTQYSYDTYGKEYIRNLDTGNKIATIYYATHLQGIRYYIKYYNEDKNSIVCEKRNFGYIDTVDGGAIGTWEEQYSTPELDLDSVSGTGTIPTIF
jgi:hypothetical protein